MHFHITDYLSHANISGRQGSPTRAAQRMLRVFGVTFLTFIALLLVAAYVRPDLMQTAIGMVKVICLDHAVAKSGSNDEGSLGTKHENARARSRVIAGFREATMEVLSNICANP